MPTKTKAAPISVKCTKWPSRKTKHAPQDTETKTKVHKPRRAKQARPKQTKTTKILGLLRRPDGASIAALCKATGWQAHSVRGFLSGTVRKRMGLNVMSETDGKGLRRYRIESASDKAEA